MSVALMTRESADRSLMHYRISIKDGGAPNGVRQWQNKDGSYTPAGYLHYKEMYGWGDKKKKTEGKEEKPAVEKSNKEIKAEVKGKIADFNAKKEERLKERESKKKEREAKWEEIRNMADDELDKRIARLKKERTYAELLDEREDREKSPVARMANKLFKDAVEDLGKKGMNLIVDQIIGKAKEKMNANSSNNGNSNNNSNSNGNNSNNNNSNNNTNSDGNNSNGQNGGHDFGGMNKNQRRSIRGLAKSGTSVADLAQQFGVSETAIRNIINASGSN